MRSKIFWRRGATVLIWAVALTYFILALTVAFLPLHPFLRSR